MSKFSYIALVLVSLFAAACARQSDYIRSQGMIWNTTYNIVYKSDRDLTDSINAVFNRIDASASVFNSNSLVSALNESVSLKVDSTLINIYEVARRVNKLSGGLYDPTLSPLIDAWGFGRGHKVNPEDTARIGEILKYVGFNKTSCSNGVISKEDRRIQFNFSSVAKGYGCDAVAEMFRRNGVDDYMIEIGGEIAVGGVSPRGGKWNISIDRPVQSDSLINHDSQCVVSLTDCGMATSGNYRNYRTEGGQIIAHTISPLTGRPVRTDVLSATVIAPTSAEADALATACMAMGADKAIKMFDEIKYPLLLILEDSTVCANSRFSELILNQDSPN